MTKKSRFFALAVAVLVNVAALATVHTAMGEITRREQAAQLLPDRIVVASPRVGGYQFAARTCAAPNTL